MSKTRTIFTTIVLLSSAVGSGCRMPPECEEFYGRPYEERYKLFRTYTVAKQVNLYLCGMKREPPDMALADEISDGGKSIIPFLVDRLEAEKDEFAQENIIYVLELMSEKGYLRGRKDVIDQVRQVVSLMKYANVRERAQQRIANIQGYSTE